MLYLNNGGKIHLIYLSPCQSVCLSTCVFVSLHVCSSVCSSLVVSVCYNHCQQIQQLYTFVTVQDVLVTGLDGLAAKVQSLENKYVKFLYKKVAAIEKCNPCYPHSGEHYNYI